MKPQIGTKVRLNQRYARWHLEHPEVYEYYGGIDKMFDVETKIHLLACMGEPVYGVVKSEYQHSCHKAYLVYWEIDGLKADYWVMLKDIEVVR